MPRNFQNSAKSVSAIVRARPIKNCRHTFQIFRYGIASDRGRREYGRTDRHNKRPQLNNSSSMPIAAGIGQPLDVGPPSLHLHWHERCGAAGTAASTDNAVGAPLTRWRWSPPPPTFGLYEYQILYYTVIYKFTVGPFAKERISRSHTTA